MDVLHLLTRRLRRKLTHLDKMDLRIIRPLTQGKNIFFMGPRHVCRFGRSPEICGSPKPRCERGPMSTGHLEIGQWHLRDTDVSLLYLDLFLYLQYVAQFLVGRWDADAGYGTTFPTALDAIQREDSEFREYSARSAGFGSHDDFLAATRREGFGYQDIPMIIEAFRATVDEGRRIGMPEVELAAYMISPAGGPMTRDAQNRFYRNVGIRLNRDARRKKGGGRSPP